MASNFHPSRHLRKTAPTLPDSDPQSNAPLKKQIPIRIFQLAMGANNEHRALL